MTAPTEELKIGDRIRRDFRGRPYIYNPEREKEITYTRTSTFAKALSDGDSLSWWRQERLVEGLLAQPQILRACPDNLEGDERKAALGQVIVRALDAGGANDAANWGTTLHHFADLIDFTDEPLTRDMWNLDDSIWDALDSYVELTKDIEMLSGEQFVVNDELKVAGSYDRTVLWKGRKVVADLKTGAIRLPDHCIQTALYANSKHYDIETGQRVPGPLDDIDRTVGLIIHLPRPGVKDSSGKPVLPKIVPVDLVQGWELAQLADQVRRARNAKVALPAEGME